MSSGGADRDVEHAGRLLDRQLLVEDQVQEVALPRSEIVQQPAKPPALLRIAGKALGSWFGTRLRFAQQPAAEAEGARQAAPATLGRRPSDDAEEPGPQAGEAVEVPVYDFATYQRRDETRDVEPRRVILVEGILIFADKELREMMDVKLYVDTDADLRFIRRLQRDTRERDRTVEMVIRQYLNTVRPMHLEFVEPSKRYADVIIPAGGFNEAAIQMIVARIQGMLAGEVL